MKGIWMAGMMLGLLASCERKEQQAGTPPPPGPDQHRIAATGSGTDGPAGGEGPSGKTSERPVLVKKKPPVAEPVTDKPGFVKSPFSGKIIDVRGIPAGTLVADPMFPSEEKRHFVVPELSPEDEQVLARENAPEAKPVSGKPGFIFSPYDNKIIDATGMKPGEVVADPNAPAGEVRYIKIPDAAPAILDPTKLIDPPPTPPSEEP